MSSRQPLTLTELNAFSFCLISLLFLSEKLICHFRAPSSINTASILLVGVRSIFVLILTISRRIFLSLNANNKLNKVLRKSVHYGSLGCFGFCYLYTN